MGGEEDWIVEVDGLPPANSDMAYSGRYDTFGEPIWCCETVKSPPMGDITTTFGMSQPDIFFAVVALAVVAIAVWLIGSGDR